LHTSSTLELPDSASCSTCARAAGGRAWSAPAQRRQPLAEPAQQPSAPA
jgi:hypothetical protein